MSLKTGCDGAVRPYGYELKFNAEDFAPKIFLDKAKRTKIRKVTIKQVDTGYIVKVGCKTIAIESEKKLVEVFTKYLQDPGGTEELYEKGKLFKK